MSDRAAGDEFEAALLATLPVLRRRAQKLTNGREAKDLVQDAMLLAWAARSHFTPGTNMEAWCMTILRNRFLSLTRKAAVRPTVPLDDIHPSAIQLSVSSSAHWSLVMRDAAEAFDGLSPHHQEALIRVVCEGETHEDAAAAVGVAVGTMKSRVFRARRIISEAAQP